MCAALRPDVRSEWDEAKEHDVLFLLTIRPPDATELARMRTQGAAALNPMELYGLTHVRGLEVIEVKDEGERGPPSPVPYRAERVEFIQAYCLSCIVPWGTALAQCHG